MAIYQDFAIGSRDGLPALHEPAHARCGGVIVHGQRAEDGSRTYFPGL